MSRWTRRELLADDRCVSRRGGTGRRPARQHRPSLRLTLAARFRPTDDGVATFDAADVTAAGPLMVCVHDAEGGNVSILHGIEEIVVNDRQLVAKIAFPRQVRRQESLKELAMSSHREAPEISKDPVADSTDPMPSFHELRRRRQRHSHRQLRAVAGTGRWPELLRVRRRRALRDQGRQQRRRQGRRHLSVHLHDRGDEPGHLPLQHRADPVVDRQNWNRRQTYTVVRVDAEGKKETLGEGLACPPCNIGPLSTPNYDALVAGAIHDLPNGGRVFAGQRAEGFYVDLGAIFDLGILRPFQQLHLTFGLENTGIGAMAAGVNSTGR